MQLANAPKPAPQTFFHRNELDQHLGMSIKINKAASGSCTRRSRGRTLQEKPMHGWDDSSPLIGVHWQNGTA
jgi:uncharacterized Zn finger protein